MCLKAAKISSLPQAILQAIGILSLSIALVAQQPAPESKAKPETKTRSLVQPEAETKAVAQRPSGKTYALIIGISSYGLDPPVRSLQFADKDAETFAALLKTPIGGELQSQDQIRLLTNEKATRAGVDDAVREMASLHGTAANTLIVFVAAHGVYLKTEEDPETHRVIQRDPYILTYESNPQDAKTTGYPMADFRRMIAEQAEHFGRVLVFLDVCHAGNVAGIGGGTDLEASVRRVFEGRAGELGVMLASHAKKFALESSNFGGGHGAFSYFLISGLNGEAAQPGTNEITFANLAVYVVKNVSQFTGSQQTPDYVATDDDMVLVADTRKARLGLPPAQPLSDSEVRSLRARHTRGINPPTPSSEPQPAADAFEQAIQQGRLLPEDPGSAVQLLAALKNDPSQSQAAIGQKQRQLQVALEDRGQRVMTRYLEGEEIPQTKADFERCGKLFQEALRLKSDAEFDRSRALFCEGRARIFDGQYADAQRLLESSIQIDPKRAYAYNALGIAQLEQIARTGQGFDAAIDALHNAMRYAPYWAYPVHNLALVSSERGDYDRAIQLYQYAMSIAPRYSYLPYNLGLLYERIGDFDNANIWFEKARVVLETYGRRGAGVAWPERARIWNALGTVARSQDRYSRALQFFQKALADDPQDLNARHNLALALATRSEFSQADTLWLANIQAAPDFLPSRIAYAASLDARGEKAAAIDQYEQIIAGKPEYVGAQEALAKLYLGQGEAARALDEINSALARSPSNSALLELRGDAHARLGQDAAAHEDWNKALSIAPDRAFRARVTRKLRS